MAKVVYVGPHNDGVDVPLPDGRVVYVPPGGELDTSDEHAKALLEQVSNWARPASASKEKA